VPFRYDGWFKSGHWWKRQPGDGGSRWVIPLRLTLATIDIEALIMMVGSLGFIILSEGVKYEGSVGKSFLAEIVPNTKIHYYKNTTLGLHNKGRQNE